MNVGWASKEQFEGTHPVRTALRLYSGQRRRLTFAATAFALKHSPVWVMPLLTANLIDAVVEEKPIAVLWVNAGVMAVLILLNVPLTSAYARWLSLAVRRSRPICGWRCATGFSSSPSATTDG